MSSTLSHVAVLVPSAGAAAAVCEAAGWALGPVEDFPAEGTREVYVGPPADDARLLLMEAIGPGPYRRALERRGPGLHHVAVDVGSIDAYLAGVAGAGWLLHPASLRTRADRGVVYLARPGLGALIEVQERPDPDAAPARPRFVAEVHVAGAPDDQRRLDALGVPGLRLAGREGPAVVIGGRRLALAALAGS